MIKIFKNIFKYAKTLIKWVFFACLVGVFGGVLGSMFHHSIDFVTHFRRENTLVIYLLPLAGFVIALLYGCFKNKGRLDTNRVIEAATDKTDVPFVMLPLMFIGSVITHLVGGSAGREGAALQLGGSVGYNTGKIFKLKRSDLNILVMMGMSAVFSALFGTPFAAAVFAVEVALISASSLVAIIPCAISSFSGYFMSLFLGISPVRFDILGCSGYSFEILGKSFVVAVTCALVSILFCLAIRKTEYVAKKTIKSTYLRGVLGGALILSLTLIVGTYDYNGAGMNIIENAISGSANYEAFALKIIFTAITVAAGFKGGEIVPSFFVGATLGCVLGSLLGIDAGLGATIGFVSLFCGITKCPFASCLLALEVFGADWIVLYILICVISYTFSGKTSIYESKNSIIYRYKKVSAK